jgi:hypothetical protein
MTSEEIKKFPIIGIDEKALEGKTIIAVETSMRIQNNMLIKEIAYQLAVMNERLSSWSVVRSAPANASDGFLGVKVFNTLEER